MLTSTVSVLDALYNRLEHPLARLAHAVHAQAVDLPRTHQARDAEVMVPRAGRSGAVAPARRARGAARDIARGFGAGEIALP